MSTKPIDQLHQRLQTFQHRRFQLLLIQQICLGLVGGIILFSVLAFLEKAFQFMWMGRLILSLSLLFGMGGLVWWIMHRIGKLKQDEHHVAQYIEEHIPDLEQRLLTTLEFGKKEKAGVSLHLIEQLWEDAHKNLASQDIFKVIRENKTWLITSGATLVTCIFLLSLWSIPDLSRSSLTVIWPWSSPTPVPALIVEPGDVQIQSGEDVTLLVTAENMSPEQVNLFLQTDRLHWKSVPMHQEAEEQSYIHYLSEVTQDIHYYIDTGSERTRQYRISVVEHPHVTQLQIEYLYPPYTGLESTIKQGTGNINALVGTEVVLHVTFNKPIQEASLKFGSGKVVPLEPHGTLVKGSFIVQEDETYVIQVIDQTQLKNRNPEEYSIHATVDAPPEIAISRPGKDVKVTPLEEVVIAATAKDDYGLTEFMLHYRVAGSSTTKYSFLGESSSRSVVDGKILLYLEDLQVKPGDFLTYYFTAADSNPSSHFSPERSANKPPLTKPSSIKQGSTKMSDIYFLEVTSTEEEFRRGSQMGGGGAGGGGGQSSSALAQNQKKVIVATWKLHNQQNEMEPKKFSEDVQVVAESQNEIMQRAQMSFLRLAERFSFSDKSYDQAVQHMKQAIQHMKLAIEQLLSEDLENALIAEQDALQEILKAEAQSRQTQILLARNGRAGGQGNFEREREDLRQLFEMEMGQLENRYELPQQGNSLLGGNPRNQREQSLRKLQELARRQERLNRQQNDFSRRKNQMTEEQQKRRLEELRREQEKLRQETEALSQQLNRPFGQKRWNQVVQQMRNAERRLLQRKLPTQEKNPDTFPGNRALQGLRKEAKQLARNDSQPNNLPQNRSGLIEQAATDAQHLRQEMEALQQQIESLKQGNWLKRQLSSLLDREGNLRPTEKNNRPARVSREELSQLREGLQGLREQAGELIQSWAGGTGWVYDARSIHRQLTQQEIEDFLTQPELWQQLLSAAKELESTLTTQSEIDQLQKKLFSTLEEEIPASYQHLIENYYQNLSETIRQ